MVQINVDKFNGNILKWQVFWDQFNSAIHTKTNISDIDQFSYLKSFLRFCFMYSIRAFTFAIKL